MTWAGWSDQTAVHLANVNVPKLLIDCDVPDSAFDGDLKFVDLVLDRGRIKAILPAGSAPAGQLYDADGRQAWPLFADLHAHLDKGQTWPRISNSDGTLETARALVRADARSYWSPADVEARFEFSLKTAYAHGTTAIRTHIDCLVPSEAAIGFEVFRRLRDRWASRINLQAVALVSTDLYDHPDNAGLIDLIADVSARLGGITYRLTDDVDPMILDGRLDRLFAIAKSRGLDVDLHVDENGQTTSATLAQIAKAVLRADFRGQVVCGHCCSLAVQDDEVAQRTISLVREAGLIIVSLPLINPHIQGRRPGRTPFWRGITLLQELQSAGVKVALASDNCRDPCHPFGDHDLLDVLGAGIRIGQLEGQVGTWSTSVTRTPLAVMGLEQVGALKAGCRADFTLFQGRSFSELFARRQSDRVVVRNGQPIDTTLPDFRTLDHLMRLKRTQASIA